ncbi:hypothetical protein HZH66_004670 [Vespula vulgaris]|uniref:Uncharacterized protein n=1 Tax=Vespula vulgaris TaxID=7454 RepID=A0A834K9A5_VESVU|nr:uncharacterized protein LOC127063182 isoform X2 [Vespula vulgaris]KAF7402403.1 hypothetical protein HZH66_004670 [Vespula vulgaris]
MLRNIISNMFQDVTSTFAIKLYSLMDIVNFLPYPLNIWDKRIITEDFTGNNNSTKNVDILLGYFILLWAALYLVYEKCLNSLLRRMRIPLTQRYRIIEAIWNCGFCFGSICYVMSIPNENLNFSSHGFNITHKELAIVLHKSFFFHRAGVAIICHSTWIRGLANLLFASFILNMLYQKWCVIENAFLFYRALDIILIDICRILLCTTQVSGKAGKVFAKILFSFHCLNWVYLYVFFVPKLMWPEKVNHMKVDLALWLWFVAECLDSIWLRLCGCGKTAHWLEICLFPPPSQEAIELANIQRRHINSLKKSVNTKSPKKKEFWQALLCAMVIKKKINRIRNAKETNSQCQSNLELISDANDTEIVEEIH